MVQAAFGQLPSWDDAVSGGGQDYLTMKDDGDYVLRFLTETPFEYMIHWVELGPKKVTKVKCASRGCILCAKNNQAKNTFIANVLDRKTGRCHVYEFGRQVFDQLKRYVKNPRWGDVRKYDVRINKEKGRKPNVYIVQAEPPISPLTDDEMVMAREFVKERGDLNKLSAPYTNDDIRKKLVGFGDESGFDAPPTSTATRSAPGRVAAATVVDETETGFDFPEFNSADFN